LDWNKLSLTFWRNGEVSSELLSHPLAGATLAGRRVLVTGAGGFIGSHLTEALLGVGADVTAMIRYNSRGDIGALRLIPVTQREKLRIVPADLKDFAAVVEIVKGIDIVFHLGALIGIPYSYVHPIDYVQTNITGTAHLLEACRHGTVSRIVQFSTSEVYGTALYTPIDEEHPLQAQSPYAASKIAADQLGLSYFRSFGLPVAIARPFNTYGPRQPARAIIPTIIGQALAGPIVRLGSLTPLRDMNYVSDTVSGVLRIAESDAAAGEVINLGSTREISVGDIAQAIFQSIGGNFRIETDPARIRPEKSEVFRLLADCSKASRLLGWTPSVRLEEGIARTVAWARENLDMLKVDHYHT
jgi:dTDP-glucose 4,6-dehydratase